MRGSNKRHLQILGEKVSFLALTHKLQILYDAFFKNLESFGCGAFEK